ELFLDANYFMYSDDKIHAEKINRIRDPIEKTQYFLTHGRGVCFEFNNAAAALLMQEFKIPARVCSGRLVDNPQGGIPNEGHAWVEYCDQEGSWHSVDFTSPNSDDTVLPSRHAALETPGQEKTQRHARQSDKHVNISTAPQVLENDDTVLPSRRAPTVIGWSPRNPSSLYPLPPNILGLTTDSIERSGDEFTTDHGDLDIKRMMRGELKNRRRLAVNSSTAFRSIILEGFPAPPPGQETEEYAGLLCGPLESLIQAGVQIFYYNEQGNLTEARDAHEIVTKLSLPQSHSKRFRKDDDSRLVINRDSSGFIQKMIVHYYDGMLEEKRKNNPTAVDDATLLAEHFSECGHTFYYTKRAFTLHLPNKTITVKKELYS
ncbi:MAG: transglutaminase-like domain-containing protein, partial [Burkholderiaceae bacterium]